MEIHRGRPVIQSADHPLIIIEALRETGQAWQDNRPPAEVFQWVGYGNANAWGSIEDIFNIIGDEVFRPHSETVIYMSLDQLEFTLVAYGYQLLDQGEEINKDKILKIDELLSKIDELSGRFTLKSCVASLQNLLKLRLAQANS